MTRHLIAASSLAFVLTIGAQAQGRGRSQGQIRSQGSGHSNAPAGTPAASSDRDFGRERAEDVGRGKKVGLDHKKQDKGKHKATKGKSQRSRP